MLPRNIINFILFFMCFSEKFYYRIILFNLSHKLNLTAECTTPELFHKNYLLNFHLYCTVSSENKNFYKTLRMAQDILFYISGTYRGVQLQRKFVNYNLSYQNGNLAGLHPLHFFFLDNFICKYLSDLNSKDLYFKFLLLHGSHLFFSFRDIYDFNSFNILQNYHDYYHWSTYINFIIKKPLFLVTKTTPMLGFLLYSEFKLNL